MKHDRQLIFLTEFCNLCNAFVDFLLRKDREHLFDFAPLQGETAKRTLPAHLPAELRSVALWSQGAVYEKSDAALMVLTQLGGIFNLLRIFWVLPKGLRDWGYDLVARNRYSLFGKRGNMPASHAAGTRAFPRLADSTLIFIYETRARGGPRSGRPRRLSIRRYHF